MCLYVLSFSFITARFWSEKHKYLVTIKNRLKESNRKGLSKMFKWYCFHREKSSELSYVVFTIDIAKADGIFHKILKLA